MLAPKDPREPDIGCSRMVVGWMLWRLIQTCRLRIGSQCLGRLVRCCPMSRKLAVGVDLTESALTRTSNHILCPPFPSAPSPVLLESHLHGVAKQKRKKKPKSQTRLFERHACKSTPGGYSLECRHETLLSSSSPFCHAPGQLAVKPSRLINALDRNEDYNVVRICEPIRDGERKSCTVSMNVVYSC